jgi:hypothetical protein
MSEFVVVVLICRKEFDVEFVAEPLLEMMLMQVIVYYGMLRNNQSQIRMMALLQLDGRFVAMEQVTLRV